MTQPALNLDRAKPALAYTVNRWSRLLWQIRSASGTPRKAEVELANQIEGRLSDNGHDDPVGEADRLAGEFAPEVFGRLYEAGDRPVDAPVSWAKHIHDTLDALPEWDTLRQQVRGDADFSALVAASLIESVADKVGDAMEAAERRDDPGYVPTPEQHEADVQQALEMRAALRAGIAGAAEAAEAARSAIAGVLPGSEHVPAVNEQRDDRRLRLAEALMNNPDVRDVMRKAGRLRRIAERKSQEADPHARSEVVGIERGGDVARLLPSEMAYFADEDLELLLLHRVANGRALQYKLEGKQTLGRGPIVLLIDESGSMSHGDRSVWARAVAIAAVSQGRREKRDVAIAFFDTQVRGTHVIDARGNVEGGGAVEDVIRDLITRGTGGGTRFDPAINFGCDRLDAGHERSDLIFVTDGMASASGPAMERLTAARDRGTRVYGLTVGGGSVSPAMADICDVCVDIDNAVDVEAELAAAVPVRSA